jgi:hypothetical protein
MSAVLAFSRGNPRVAAAVAPNDPRANAAVTASEPTIGTNAVDEARLEAAYVLLGRAPLAPEPFLLAGIAALGDGGARDAEPLLVEARRRNPRLRGARFALLELYLRQNRAREAGTELAVLRRLVPQMETVVVPQLAQLARDRRTAAELLAVLRQDPALHEAVLAALAENGSDPELILSMAPQRTTRSAPWQQALVNRMVQDGQVGRAYSLWARFLGIAAAPGGRGIYDGAFRGEPGAPPFGWALATTEAGVAEMSRGALEAQFFGRENVTLASQLLMLPQGRHSLRFQVEGDAVGDDGRLVWRVQCKDRESPLVELPLRDIGSAPQRRSVTFNVPATCGAQWLRLVGEAGDIPQTQTIIVRNLEVTRESRP